LGKSYTIVENVPENYATFENIPEKTHLLKMSYSIEYKGNNVPICSTQCWLILGFIGAKKLRQTRSFFGWV